MGKNKDIQRAKETGMVMRSGRLIPIGAKLILKPRENMLRCHKCGDLIAESFVDQHIMKCQGGKAECGKCQQWINGIGFMEHYRNCEGTHELIARTKPRRRIIL